MPAGPARSPYERVRNALLRHRIRIHLFSGIEFEMTVFVIGPLIGFVFWTSIVAGVLLLLFEALLVVRLCAADRPVEGPAWRPPRRQREQVSPEPTPTRV